MHVFVDDGTSVKALSGVHVTTFRFNTSEDALSRALEVSGAL